MSLILTSPTLVLNKSWLAIDSTTARDAICSVLAERALFVDPFDNTKHNIHSWIKQPVLENDLFIRTVGGRIKLPEIMLLHEYNKSSKRAVVFCRLNLWKRDNQQCQYCGIKARPDLMSVDHVIPLSRKGNSCFENCVLSCVKCNMKKRNRTPEEAGMRLRRSVVDVNGDVKIVFYDRPKHPAWHPYYTIKKLNFPKSWEAFVKKFDDTLYWQVQLEQ